MRYTILLFATLATLCGSVFAQDERPLIDLVGDQSETTDVAEDIPPPLPVPDSITSNPAAGSTETFPTPVTSTVTGPEEHAYDFGVSYAPNNQGLKVSGVIVGSRASAAGVRPGDTIVSVNEAAPNADALKSNQVQSLTIVRNGVQQVLRTSGSSTPQPNGTAAYVPNSVGPTAAYVPRSRTAYSVPRTTAYSVPRTTVSTPQRYSPSYNYRYSPDYAYRTAVPYSARYYSYRRPSVAIGVGVGRGIGYGPSFGYPGFGYSRFGGGFGGIGPYGFGGRGVGFSRGGIGISIGF